MKSLDFAGEITEYQGETVNPPVKFSGKVDQFENLQEAKNSEDWPGDSEILKMINAKKLANARSAAYQSATADLKANYEKTPAYRLKQLIKAIQLGDPKMSLEQATGIAESVVSR